MRGVTLLQGEGMEQKRIDPGIWDETQLPTAANPPPCGPCETFHRRGIEHMLDSDFHLQPMRLHPFLGGKKTHALKPEDEEAQDALGSMSSILQPPGPHLLF